MKKSSNQNFFRKKKKPLSSPPPINFENLRLNKFMAYCNVGNRRACEVVIKKGLVTVNGEVVTDSAYRVKKEDEIKYDGKKLELKKQYTYILLNKPKNYLPSLEKSEEQKSYHDIFFNKIKSNVKVLENLSAESLGLVLLTDDEFLLEKKSKGEMQLNSIFHIILSEELKEGDFEKLQKSLIQKLPNIHSLNPVKDNVSTTELILQLKGSDDQTLREVISDLGCEVKKLDRVSINGLTKKDLPRGRFRILSEKEGVFLKHFS